MKIIEKVVAVSPFFDCIDAASVEDDLFAMEHFTAGQTIFRQGDEGLGAYVVLSGVIGLYEQVDPESTTLFLKASQGRLFGEYAMLCGERRSATAVAIVDTVLAYIDRINFQRLLDLSKELCNRVISSLARQASRGRTSNRSDQLKCTLVRTALANPDSLGFSLICDVLSRFEGLDVIDKRGLNWDENEQLGDIVRTLESDRSVVFIVDQEISVSATALQLIDTSVLVVDGNEIGTELPIGPGEVLDLVRVWPAEQKNPVSLPEYPEGLVIRHIYNIRSNLSADARRVARCILGIPNTLVLGGGGAKGFAHVGTMKAMAEMNIDNIDMVYGVSIGAFIGMLYTFEMPWDAICEYMKSTFIEGAPYSFSPSVHSLLRYDKGLARLEADFGHFNLHDTWIPFRPVSTNISSNRLAFWSDGPLLKRVIASMSLPGIVPPVQMDDGSFHVDGGILDNLPIAEARRSSSGFIIAISLDHGEGQRVLPTIADVKHSLMPWLVSAGLANRSMPPLTDTIIYSMLCAARQKSDNIEHLADVMLKPDLTAVGLLDWSCFDATIEAGYREAKERLGSIKA